MTRLSPFLKKHQSSFLLLMLAVTVITAIFIYNSATVSSQEIKPVKAITAPAQMSAPLASKAVAFGESIRVRDMPPAPAEREPAKENPVEAASPEIGRGASGRSRIDPLGRTGIISNDPLGIKDIDVGKVSGNSSFLVSPQTLPTPSVSFEGISVFDTADIGQGFLPPDTTGEAGPNHYVQAVNVAFRVWDKSGNPLTPLVSLGSLFSSLSGPCTASLGGFPQVIYDQLADRWLISQQCTTVRPNHFLVAVSKTGDPTGAYYLYDFQMPHTKSIDSSKLALWPDGYYMTNNQFDRSGLGFFQGGGIFAFDRAKMLTGDQSAGFVYFDTCPGNLNCTVAGALPSDLDGFGLPPAGAPNVFAVYTADDFSDPQGDGLRMFDFHVDWNNPANSTFTERAGSPMPVQAFDARPGFVPQPETPVSRYLQSIGDRLMFRMPYRNFGPGNESLIVTHSVDTIFEGQGPPTLRYYQLNRSTPSGPFTIAEQQTFTPDDTSRWMPSAAMNFLGDTAVGYSASSTTVYPSIRYAAKLATDPPGSGLAQGEQTIIAGGGSQFSTSRRWGTYSHMSVDPTDDCSFWYTNEYYAQSNTNGWQTRIAKFAPRPCSVSPRGTIQGTVTSCSTGQPVPGVLIEAPGGISRTTGPNGSYTFALVPGTYSITPQKLGYSAPSIGGIAVSNGSTVTQNFCMVPIPALSGSAIVTKGNSLLEPNECNTLNIPLTNKGAIPALSVTATLSTTTPGVTITQATSSYPALGVGRTRVNSVPFRITLDGAVGCLSNVDLTLTVSFAGAGSPAILPFKMKVGEPIGPNYVFTASTGATLPTTGVFVPGSNEFATFSSPIAVPFAFTLYGKPVAAGEIIHAGESGMLEADPSLPNDNSINERLPTMISDARKAALFPYWDDIEMRGDSVQGGGIFIETTGNAPNRSFMVEWRARRNGISGPIDTDFAVFFHENSDSFDYVYKLTGGTSLPLGTMNGNAASVGVQGKSYGTNYTQYSYHFPVIFPGLKLTATRPAAICTHGSGSCAGPSKPAAFDYDGDWRTDISLYRVGAWYLQQSRDGLRGAIFGDEGDKITPADFDGDGRTDVAFYRPNEGNWYVMNSSDNLVTITHFGIAEDFPIPGDFDGDGMADINVFRPSSGVWFQIHSSNGSVAINPFGSNGDKPQAGDFDGDGKADIAVFRPSNGTWWWFNSGSGTISALNWGLSTDLAVPADYDGDGKTDAAIYRPSQGSWYILRSSDGGFMGQSFGLETDTPVPGDYDGDGRADMAIYRPFEGNWWINRSTEGITVFNFGISTDKPTPSAYVY